MSFFEDSFRYSLLNQAFNGSGSLTVTFNAPSGGEYILSLFCFSDKDVFEISYFSSQFVRLWRRFFHTD